MALFPLGILSAAGAGEADLGSYDLLETYILGSSQASVVFSSLGTYSSTYKHLQIRHTNRRDTTDAGTLLLTFNGVSGTSYASHRLIANGSSVSSDGFTSRANLFAGAVTGSNAAASSFAAGVVDILDPFETSKNTTTRTLTGLTAGASFVILQSGVFLSTASITSISLAADVGNLVADSRFSLYGIKG